MPPKPFKPVDLTPKGVEKPVKAKTTKVDHSEARAAYDFGEQGTIYATVAYAGTPRSVNCTVNAPELQRGIAKQKADYAQTVASHAEFRRVKKGARQLKHKLPHEETYTEDGDITLTRPTTETTRREH